MSKSSDPIGETNQKAVEAAMNLTRLSIEQGERLLKLQLDAVSGMLEDGMKTARALAEVRDPQQWGALQQQNAQDMLDRLTAYSRSIHEVVDRTQKEIGGVFEDRLKVMNAQTRDMVDEMAKAAPSGSEPAFAAMKQTLSAAGVLAETMSKTAQQFAHSAESAIRAAAETAVKTGKPRA